MQNATQASSQGGQGPPHPPFPSSGNFDWGHGCSPAGLPPCRCTKKLACSCSPCAILSKSFRGRVLTAPEHIGRRTVSDTEPSQKSRGRRTRQSAPTNQRRVSALQTSSAPRVLAPAAADSLVAASLKNVLQIRRQVNNKPKDQNNYLRTFIKFTEWFPIYCMPTYVISVKCTCKN